MLMTIARLAPVERLKVPGDGVDRVTRCVEKRRAVSASPRPAMTMS